MWQAEQFGHLNKVASPILNAFGSCCCERHGSPADPALYFLCAVATKPSFISYAWVSECLPGCQRMSKSMVGGDRRVRKVEGSWSRGVSWSYTCRKAQPSRRDKSADSSHAFFLQDPTKAVETVLSVPYGHMWKAPPRWCDAPHKEIIL